MPDNDINYGISALEPYEPIYVLRDGVFIFLGELSQVCTRLDGSISLSILPANGGSIFS